MRMRLILATVAAAVCASSSVGPAHAGGKLLRLGCFTQPASQVFAQWNDNRFYVPFPNGGFEQGSEGWRLSGGAQVVSGNESYNLGGAGSYSLYLPAGASATTPPACIRILDSYARFMLLETGASSGSLKVELQYRGLLGMWSSKSLGSIGGSGAWQPSPAYPFLLENILGSLLTLNVTTTDVKLKITASGWGSGFRIDSAFVDPWWEGF